MELTSEDYEFIANLHLWHREQIAHQILEPVESKYRIVWEDPDNLDDSAKITVPSPWWMAMALHGGFLPPINAYIRDKQKLKTAITQSYKEVGGAEHPYARPIGPMTEEEAIEYLIIKDLPDSVLEYTGNRKILSIVKKELIPANREYRNAWEILQEYK